MYEVFGIVHINDSVWRTTRMYIRVFTNRKKVKILYVFSNIKFNIKIINISPNKLTDGEKCENKNRKKKTIFEK